MKIFVFGSNLAGRHGAGSAKEAFKNHGAIYGCGIGLQGQSYAIPTKDFNLQTIPLDQIWLHVHYFKTFAYVHSSWQFDLVAIGCGLAGYKPEQIAPMFMICSPNVNLPKEFK